jgi:hypothetical protein
MNSKEAKPYHHFFDGYTFEQEKRFKAIREEMRKILFEENELCEVVCKVYCKALIITISIGIWFCL